MMVKVRRLILNSGMSKLPVWTRMLRETRERGGWERDCCRFHPGIEAHSPLPALQEHLDQPTGLGVTVFYDQ
jgi:hypothetical protein